MDTYINYIAQTLSSDTKESNILWNTAKAKFGFDKEVYAYMNPSQKAKFHKLFAEYLLILVSKNDETYKFVTKELKNQEKNNG